MTPFRVLNEKINSTPRPLHSFLAFISFHLTCYFCTQVLSHECYFPCCGMLFTLFLFVDLFSAFTFLLSRPSVHQMDDKFTLTPYAVYVTCSTIALIIRRMRLSSQEQLWSHKLRNSVHFNASYRETTM